MTRPIAFNLPEGKSADEFLDAQYLELLNEVFEGVKQAFGDDAILYRIDIGRIFESAVSGELIIAGQFVDKSDGEVFNFEINQGTNKLGYKSSSEFLSATQLAEFLGESEVVSSAGNDDNQQEDPLYPYDLLIQAINDEDSEVYQSPFSVKLRLDIDYLGVLSLAMYRGAVSVEAQPLYAALHGYVIKYALGGLKLFSNNIRQNFGGTAGEAAEQWVEDHGVDFSAAVIKDFSARRYTELEEQLESGSTEIQQLLTRLIEDAIDMAFATTKDFIETIATSNDYQAGDITLALTHAIDEYCPIDNSDGYTTSESAKELADIWKQLLETACCPEDLSVSALGLPSDNSAGGTSQDGLSNQQEDLTGSRNEKEFSQATEESSLTQDARGQEAGDNIYYVNVGEGLHRNWDDCRKFGFLAAGGGRKWSKQLDKIKTGDTVIAYLKGHGYVGIGNVTSEALPATKFAVNGVPIRELPLFNDTIRSIKRFSKENGEYLIGVNWQVAVPREQAAWKSNARLFTTALVCASLKNQQPTIDFVYANLLPSGVIAPIVDGMTSTRAMEKLSSLADDEESDQDIESVLEELITQQWQSDEEYARFFVQVSLNMYDGLAESEAILFDRPITYSFCPGTTIWDLWTKARKLLDLVERISDEDGCIKPEMIEHFNITSIFNVLPAALNVSYDNQSLAEWLAHGIESYSREDNEFFCIFIALIEDNDNALRDITSNLRNSIVLEELVLSRPELIASEEFLVEGYCSNGLLYNRSLSTFSLTYLSSLLIGTSLGLDGAASGKINAGTLTVDESDVICFREEHEDTLAEIDLEGIADLIRVHPNCSPKLAEALSK